MRTKHTIFRRIILLAFVLIAALSILFISIAYFATTNFHEASTQQLNNEVAAHIAKFTSPYDINGLDKEKAAAVFHQAMILSPSAEVYFLDTSGRVMAYDSTKAPITEWTVPIKPLQLLIASGGKRYIKGLDPRDPSAFKIFSAAEVIKEGKLLGYIYVVLGNNEYRSITWLVLKSRVTTLAIIMFFIIVSLSLLITYYYLRRIRKRFEKMLAVIERFQNGDLEARFSSRASDELGAVTDAFNRMADLLVLQVNRVVQSEEERKNLTTNISHDLRTPLSIARGYSETFLLKIQSKTITMEEEQEYISLVLAKILQVENLVMQLFELSVMESADFEPKKEPFVFSEILNELVYTFRLKAAEKDIEIICMPCENEQRIYADIRMMERLTQNLLVNAITYANEKTEITVSLEMQGDQLVFSIRNVGQMLSEELQDWLNSEKSISSIYKKSEKPSIGLSIVKKIVEIHDYSLQVRSENSVVIFTVVMPFY